MNANAARIYSEGRPSNEPPKPRTTASLPQSTVVSIVRPTAQVPVKQAAMVSPTVERDIVNIIEAPPHPGETTELAFRRKEHELGELFATLSVTESRTLHRRLSIASTNDQVAKAFGRMVAERRMRLLAFLADVRRREALASARKVAP
jgi:hypothetical protein